MNRPQDIARGAARVTPLARKIPRKKVLIINCYFPEYRIPLKRVNESPDTAAPVLLAGYFDATHCDVRLYNEVNSGFVEIYEPDLLKWPDMVVITGLSVAYDRLLHVTAYTKSYNPAVITVAGGHGVRSLPDYSKRFFDYVCLGNVEQIADVIADAFGREYVSEIFNPRYDLAYWMRWLGYVESSRNCNFRCGFCSLTASGLPYQVQSLDYLDRQLENIGKRWCLYFNDNQLLGDGNKTFRARIGKVKDRIDAGQFKYWGAFVTNTFFWDDDNLKFARDSGCIQFFVGVESLSDTIWLDKVNKNQNARHNQIEIITRCQDAGILFQYGLVFDPTERTLAQIYAELDVILSTPELPLPLFTFLAIPFPGTPVFREKYENNLILPNTKMRDLESTTLCTKSLDPQEDVVRYIKTDKNMRKLRKRVIAHQAAYMKRYWHSLNFDKKVVTNLSAAAMLTPGKFTSPNSMFMKKVERTHVSTTDVLDSVYSPCLPVAEKYREYFKPTVLTDHGGEINPLVQDDVLNSKGIRMYMKDAEREQVVEVK